jgi:hypothetical protein
MKRVALAALAALCLSACATPYEGNVVTQLLGQGVESKRLDETTLYITVHGNSYTRSDRLMVYALKKAAEETNAAGYEWFVMPSWGDQSTQHVNPTLSSTDLRLSQYGNTVQGTASTMTTGGNAYTLPGMYAVVKMGKGPRPEGQVFTPSEVLAKAEAFLN